MPAKPREPKQAQSLEKLNGAGARAEPRASTAAGWNPARIRSAEQLCAAGNYSLAADLCEAMMADERVSKGLNRLYAATTLPLTFLMPGLDAKASEKDPVCQALQEDWWKILPEQQMRTLVSWLGLMRLALCHVDGWKLDPITKRVVPKLSVWSPRNLRHDAQRGWLVRSTTDGGYNSVEEAITPGDGNWIIIVAGSSYRAPYQAPWRGLSRWWLLKLYATIDWPSSSERHGQGTAVAENVGTNPIKSTPEARRELAKDLRVIERNGTVVMPDGWTYKVVTDTANTWQTFAKQTEFANSAIDIGLTGTNLTTEVNGGSRAAASVHETVDSVTMGSLLELIATGTHDQVLGLWAQFNFASVAPYPKWDTKPPKDRKAEAEARQADATAFKTYVDAGAEIDQLAWFGEGEVRLVKGASPVVKRPQAPAPAIAPKIPAGAFAGAALNEPGTAFARGRDYTDRLEAHCCEHAAKELAPTLAAVLSAITGATSYDDAKERIKAAYGDELPPSKLVKLTEAALIMGQMAGRETVEQEFIAGE
jgi:phage gp29-like protein